MIWRKVCVLLVLFIFSIAIVSPSGFSQEATPLPVPGARLALSPAFVPALLTGIKVYRDDPLRFDFILDQGDPVCTSQVAPAKCRQASVQEEALRLIKYFFASVTIPENDLWVNLSPYEKDRIVPDAFGQTEMGRDLLAQDYILKQITASVLYPEGDVGKQFWAKVYARAQEKFGTIDIPVDTFNKVWIVPEKAVVQENNATAFVVETRMKVLVESDYLAASSNTSEVAKPPTKWPAAGQADMEAGSSATQELTKQVIREVVVPLLEKEVNEGKNFASLRQVYHSLILAEWYKRKIKSSLLEHAYSDRKKIAGIDIEDKGMPEKIWLQYVEAFKEGVYSYVKDEYDSVSRETIPRKYFSGGADMSQIGDVYEEAEGEKKLAVVSKDSVVIKVRGIPVDPSGKEVNVGHPLHDPRVLMVEHLNKALVSDKILVQPTGITSISLTPEKAHKGTAVQHIFEDDADLETLLYFGNEFGKNGGDHHVVVEKIRMEKASTKRVVVFAVDVTPSMRSKMAKVKTTWLGKGPLATQQFLEELLDTLDQGDQDALNRLLGINIDLNVFRQKAALYFDVDDTLIPRDSRQSLTNFPQIQQLLKRLLEHKVKVGVISTNDRLKQIRRMSDPLAAVLEDVSFMTFFRMYVNNGVTLIRYDRQGRSYHQNFMSEMPWSIQDKVSRVIQFLARSNYGWSPAEMIDVEKRFKYSQSLGYGTLEEYPHVRFRFPKSGQPFVMSFITNEELEAIKSGERPAKDLTVPFGVIRELGSGSGVQMVLTPIFDLKVFPFPDASQSIDKAEKVGIDLNPSQMDFQSRGMVDAAGFRFNEQQVQQIEQSTGIKPVIMDIQAMPDLSLRY